MATEDFKCGLAIGILMASMLKFCRAIQGAESMDMDRLKELAKETEGALDQFISTAEKP